MNLAPEQTRATILHKIITITPEGLMRQHKLKLSSPQMLKLLSSFG